MFALLFIAFSIFPTDGHAKTYSGRIAYVIDVDTYALDVRLDGQSQRIKLNLAGIQAPQLYGDTCERQRAEAAKAFVQKILWPNEIVRVKNIRVRDKRVEGEIKIGDRDLANILVQFKQATPKNAPVKWCERS